MNGSPGAVKRFYQSVETAETERGVEVRLDGKPLRTKQKQVLLAPSASLADAIKAEWEAQGEHIDFASTPLTGLLSEAIDADAAALWRNDILAYLQSDLVCYRAETPAALVERQAIAWDPYLNWLRDELGAALMVTSGVVSTPQPEVAIDRVRAVMSAASPETLSALGKATATTGSAVMALALWKKAFPPTDIFSASVVDETFQAEKWGDDAEARDRRLTIRNEFLTIARFLELLEAD